MTWVDFLCTVFEQQSVSKSVVEMIVHGLTAAYFSILAVLKPHGLLLCFLLCTLSNFMQVPILQTYFLRVFIYAVDAMDAVDAFNVFNRLRYFQ